MSALPTEIKLTKKDFVSDQTVRWCPGCGDYSILAQMQKVMPELGIPKEKIVFISGIGCSSRFPYYMNTYGIHSIHGRAPTLATGLALANPELSIWVITGDGDGLSIGGNHLLHAIRRNININIILFNNRIYGLTKGQFSPTSRLGMKTKSSPMGVIEQPVHPLSVALAAEATFVARSLDAYPAHLEGVLRRAAEHPGTSFVEIYQNCVIFNPTEWAGLDDRRTRSDHLIELEHGKPLIFGKDRNKGVRLNGFTPEIVNLSDVNESELLVHDATSKEMALVLANMEFPSFPAPIGVIRDVRKPDYGAELMGQVRAAQEKKGSGDLNKLYRTADMWTVSPREEPQPAVKGEVSQELWDEYIDEMERPEAALSEFQDKLVSEAVAVLNPRIPITVEPHSSLARAVRQMKQHNIGCLLVTDEEDKLVGIFTEQDLLMRVAGQVEDMMRAAVNEYMTEEPVTMKETQPIAQALHLMSIHGFRHVPLVDDLNRPTGIISFRDVVGYLNRGMSFAD